MHENKIVTPQNRKSYHTRMKLAARFFSSTVLLQANMRVHLKITIEITRLFFDTYARTQWLPQFRLTLTADVKWRLLWERVYSFEGGKRKKGRKKRKSDIHAEISIVLQPYEFICQLLYPSNCHNTLHFDGMLHFSIDPVLEFNLNHTF